MTQPLKLRPAPTHHVYSRYLGRFTATLNPAANWPRLVTVTWDDAESAPPAPAMRGRPSRVRWPQHHSARTVIEYPNVVWAALEAERRERFLISEEELQAFAAWVEAELGVARSELRLRARPSALADNGPGLSR